MSKTEHLRRVLAGGTRARPPASCWYHFPPEFHPAAPAAEAHLRHLEKYDLDFLKVMNEVDYPRDALGAAGVIQSVGDLKKLRELPGDAPPLDGQLDLVRRLAQRVGGEVPLTTTIFHTWMVLRNLTAAPKQRHQPPVMEVLSDPRNALLTQWLRADRAAVEAALQTIEQTAIKFARLCIEAGADGIYLATRDDWIDTPAHREALATSAGESGSPYDELVLDSDRAIFAGASAGWFNVLHLCGRPVRFDRHLPDPNIHVVHWADRESGPDIATARRLVMDAVPDVHGTRPALAGGVSNLKTLPYGKPVEVVAEVCDAIAAAAGYPLLITPGCTYDPDAISDENVLTMVASVRGA
ncbi:MAG: hypothetical protein KKB50_17740 [Planctomycetes bacterium]|nr:hypothetical protein [Planctomycetota bacterium]